MKKYSLATLGSLIAATAITFNALPASAQTKTLKVVAHADVKILDPTFTTAYITRNFGYMVYDMPFGQDEKAFPNHRWLTSTPPPKMASCGASHCGRA